MDWTDQVWRLWRGDQLLGGITITEQDFPWLRGRFQAEPEFAEVAALFAEELRLMERIEVSDEDVHVDAWEAAYEPVHRTMTLESPAGPVDFFLLHIDGDTAWFRWIDDEPTND